MKKTLNELQEKLNSEVTLENLLDPEMIKLSQLVDVFIVKEMEDRSKAYRMQKVG